MESMECPHCGALVPSHRICCAGCGSDLETGWMDPEQIDYKSIDLPEDELPSTPDNEPGQAISQSVVVLLALFIAAPLSFFMFDNIAQIVGVWVILGLLMGIKKSRD